MSQPAADPFVPFDPIPTAGQKSVPHPVTPGGLKVVPPPEAGPAFTRLPTPGTAHLHATPGTAGKPIVSLQREGDRVTGIRIECTCGQVIELACSY